MKTTILSTLAPIPARRGNVRRAGRWHMIRRDGRYSLPMRVADLLQVRLALRRNRNACVRLAQLLALAHCTRGKGRGAPFVAAREALQGLLALKLTEDQVRGGLAGLEAIGFLERVGGGAFDPRTRKRTPVLYRIGLDFAGLFGLTERKSPTAGLRPRERSFRGLGKPMPDLIPNGGTLTAQRTAARERLAALARERERPLRLTGAALRAIGGAARG